jgi:hypothetical protein
MRRRLVHASALLAVVLSTIVTLVPSGFDAIASAAPRTTAPAVSRPSTGYWLVAANGGVFTYGDAEFHGSVPNEQRGSAADHDLRRPIVGMAAPPNGAGYWLVSSDGGVFAFGGVEFHGSLGGQRLNKPIVSIASTPTGRGYWLVASDGGVFAFGDAGWFGSTGDIVLNQAIVGMTSTPTGRGYWLVARDGGIFTFGDAGFFGSTGDVKLNQPIVSMASTPTGLGYWMAAADGGMFTFGDASFFGSTGSVKLNKPIVAMTPTGLGRGYWLVASDGGIFSFGDAGFYGSAGGSPLNSPIVAMAPRAKPGRVGSAIFYYPWYGGVRDDPAWFHWRNDGHKPPEDIAANYYPSRGPYSSHDFTVLQQHMADIHNAGVDTIIISWWGPRSYEDDALPGVVSAASGQGLRVAIHLEPYDGRTPELVQRDVLALSSRFGIREFWIYVSDGPPAEAWQPMTSLLPDVTFWAHGHSMSNGQRGLFQSYAARAGFDGVYTYDPVQYSASQFETFCAFARARSLRCSPSVAPGFDGRRGVPEPTVVSRAGGERYDEAWVGAFGAGPDVVSITSYNEWHEGSQIEPAQSGVCLQQGQPPYCYSSYEGDYGLRGAAAEGAYLGRTRFWTDALRR